MIKVGIGQDSHRLDYSAGKKKLILGGVVFDCPFSLLGNSDADVVMHALTNAVSGITGIPVLGETADRMCGQGITDSSRYLKKALTDLDALSYKVSHVSISIECKVPKIAPEIINMRESLAGIMGIKNTDVGITATSGEELTDFGKGLGIQVFCVLTANRV